MFPSAAVDANDASINTATHSPVHQRGIHMQSTWEKLRQAIETKKKCQDEEKVPTKKRCQPRMALPEGVN